MAHEIELKLDLTPEAAEAVLASGLLPGEPTALRLRSVYFDTPARDLSAAGISLRIRDEGDVRIQTVKAAGTAAAGLFARPEWEQAVEGDRPVLDDAMPIAALLGGRTREIRPVFEIRVERLAWTIPQDDALVELVLDRGEVVAGERRSGICEIELELKSGAPGALFSLARRIDAVAPVSLGVVSKAERGFRLLGPAAHVVKAEPVVLTEDMNAADAFRHIAGACLRQYRLNEALIDRQNPDAVHQARVALRRLRSAFSIFAPLLRDNAFAGLREETKWLASSLGAARDLDVLLSDDTAGEELHARLERARNEAYDQAEAAIASRRARALMLDLSEWLAEGGWLSLPAGDGPRAEPVRDFAAWALDRFRRKVKKGGRGLEALSDEARHEVRKDAKKLRYGAEFFVSLFVGEKHGKHRSKRFVAALAALQDGLGALNDLAMAREAQARFGIEDEPSAEDAQDMEARRRHLLDAAAEAHDAFCDAKPFWR